MDPACVCQGWNPGVRLAAEPRDANPPASASHPQHKGLPQDLGHPEEPQNCRPVHQWEGMWAWVGVRNPWRRPRRPGEGAWCTVRSTAPQGLCVPAPFLGQASVWPGCPGHTHTLRPPASASWEAGEQAGAAAPECHLAEGGPGGSNCPVRSSTEAVWPPPHPQLLQELGSLESPWNLGAAQPQQGQAVGAPFPGSAGWRPRQEGDLRVAWLPNPLGGSRGTSKAGTQMRPLGGHPGSLGGSPRVMRGSPGSLGNCPPHGALQAEATPHSAETFDSSRQETQARQGKCLNPAHTGG